MYFFKLNSLLPHSVGDLILINRNPGLKDKMLKHYLLSAEIAGKIKCLKHMFTPFFWMACYLERIDKQLAVKYHIKCLKRMEKFCPDHRPGYLEKGRHSVKYLRKNMAKQISKKEWKKFVEWLKKCKNKCVVKSKGRI